MATFEVRVEGLTGLDITSTSNPTQAQLTEFLKDGVMDVMHRWIAVKPQDEEEFQRESSEITSQAGIDINGAEIISVVRESGTNNDWRRCRRISVGQQSRVTDETSLEFASKFNPAYMLGSDSKISVFPTPGSDPDAYKVYYVNNVPVDKGGDSLIYTHSDIGYFGDDKVYLVVIYAGMKSLQSAMAGMHNNANINTCFANFRSTVTDGINQFDTGKGEASDYSANLFNGLNFDQARGRFKAVKTALERANDLVNGGLPATGYDAFTYFLREDPEMVVAALQLATKEMEIAAAGLQEFSVNSDIFTKELTAYITSGSAYIQSAASYLTELQQYAALDNQRYTWYASRFAELKQEYDTAFAIARPQQTRGGR